MHRVASGALVCSSGSAMLMLPLMALTIGLVIVRGQSKPKPNQVINRSRYWRALAIVVGADGIEGP